MRAATAAASPVLVKGGRRGRICLHSSLALLAVRQQVCLNHVAHVIVGRVDRLAQHHERARSGFGDIQVDLNQRRLFLILKHPL